MTLNEKIKALRLKLNMTQHEFALTLGIKQSAISAMERGVMTTSYRRLELFDEMAIKHRVGFRFLAK